MDKLHPGSKREFRRASIVFFVFGLVPILIIVSLFLILVNSYTLNLDISQWIISNSILVVFSIIISLAVVIFIISEVYSRLSYSNFSYEISKDEITINSGIIFKSSKMISKDRVQKVVCSDGYYGKKYGYSVVDIITGEEHMDIGAFIFILFTKGFRSLNKRPRGEGHLPGIGLDESEKIRKLFA